MKYLKNYEDIAPLFELSSDTTRDDTTYNAKYKVGDYVKVFVKDLNKSVFNCFQILEIHIISHREESNIEYYTEFIRNINDSDWNPEKYKINKAFVNQKYIEKLATPKEIEEFELMKNMNKYNL